MDGGYKLNRFFLKRDAKANLRGKYSTAVLVAVIAQLLFRLSNTFTTFFAGLFTPSNLFRWGRFQLESEPAEFDELLAHIKDIFNKFIGYPPLSIALILLIIVLSLSYAILVGNVIRIGARRWFLRASHPHYSAPPLGLMFSPFRRGQYVATLSGTLWKSLWLFIWSIPVYLSNIFFFTPIVLLMIAYIKTGADSVSPALVDRVLDAYGLPEFVYSPVFFIVLGIFMILFSIVLLIKRYQYRMTDYILADNPFIGTRRALTLSKSMSKGSFWRLFVLDLSFIGWFFLASMCICIPGAAIFLILPYYEATWVEAYKNCRDDMVARRELTMEELGYVPMWTEVNR